MYSLWNIHVFVIPVWSFFCAMEGETAVCECVLTKALIFLSVWFYCNRRQDAPSVTLMGSALQEVTICNNTTSSSKYDTLWLSFFNSLQRYWAKAFESTVSLAGFHSKTCVSVGWETSWIIFLLTGRFKVLTKREQCVCDDGPNTKRPVTSVFAPGEGQTSLHVLLM